MAAACAWAAGTLDADSPAQEPEAVIDARRWGMDETAIAQIRAELGLGAATVKVWATHVPAVLAFLASSTQWRTALHPRGGNFHLRYVGLDYAGARVAIEAAAITITPGLWAGFQQLEIAARNALNGEALHQ